MVSEDAQIRLQCAEMANRQCFNGSVEDVAVSAQRLYEFVTNTRRQPPEGKARAPKRKR